MPRPRLLNPKSGWKIRLPEDLAARILSELWSEVEQCVPYGKWSEFIEMCIREHFALADTAKATTCNSGGCALPPGHRGLHDWELAPAKHHWETCNLGTACSDYNHAALDVVFGRKP
jgi:hypothetical protein